MPAPLIEFAQFSHPQRWWLRRRPPPWLDDPRWTARAFRASFALGAMGVLSGWLTIASLFVSGLVEPLLGNQAREAIWLFGAPGFCFAAGVLMPLSRWLGRGWILTLLAIPASMLACYAGMMTCFFVGPILADGPSWVPGGKPFAFVYASVVGAAIVGVWMGNPLRPSAWLAALAAAVLASAAFWPLWNVNANLGPVPSQVRELMNMARIYVSFQCLTSIGLGVRLWWPPAAIAG